MLLAKKEATDALNKYILLSHELLTSIVEMGDSEYVGRSSETIMKDIIATDIKLQFTVQQLRGEYEFYNKIDALKRRLVEKETEIFNFTTHLKRADENLRNLLDSSNAFVESIDVARSNSIEVDELVTYGHRISKTMCEKQFEQQRMGFFPPFPTQGQMEETFLFTRESSVSINKPSISNEAGFSKVLEDSMLQEIPELQEGENDGVDPGIDLGW